MPKKITNQIFIDRATTKHDGYYNYSLTEYIGMREKVKIMCPIHGIFEQTPDSHLQGSGCILCVKKEHSTESFINDSKKLFGDKYIYDKCKYVNYNTKLTITCKLHGDFKQTIASHLKNQEGCKKCYKIKTSHTKEQCIKDFKKIHGDKYDYSLVEYNGTTKKVKIICPHHGIFEQTPNSHKNGDGCRECALLKKGEMFALTTQDFIKKANIFHNNFYTYSKTIYGKNNNDGVIITCPIHGDFLQTPRLHLSKSGCPSCGSEKKYVFTFNSFKKSCIKNNNGLGIFYILRCFNNNEEFYKVGITSRSIEDRYSSSKEMPYSYKIVQEIKNTPENIWKIEHIIKRFITINKIKYEPEIYFPGCKEECYKL